MPFKVKLFLIVLTSLNLDQISRINIHPRFTREKGSGSIRESEHVIWGGGGGGGVLKPRHKAI